MVGLPIFLGAHTSPLRAFVQVPGNGLRMRAGVFRDFLQGASSLARILQRYTEALLNQIAQAAACNRLHPVEARCARWLLMTHDRVNEDRFPLTQEFLSQMLGVRRQGVTAVAGKLQDAGAIEYTRGIITVVDRDKLEAFSCSCYGVIRDEYDQMMRNPRGVRRKQFE